MATYKVTDTDLNKVTRLLDKIKFPPSPAGGVLHPLQQKAMKLSKHIKDKYTKIK